MLEHAVTENICQFFVNILQWFENWTANYSHHCSISLRHVIMYLTTCAPIMNQISLHIREV